MREVREKTGLTCTLARELPSTQYTDLKLRDKTVRYWALEPSSGSFEPNDEVDEIKWLTPDVAAERLTYSRDWTVLRSLENRQ